MPTEAKAKRAELKSSVKDEVPSEYMDELKEALDNLGDAQIMNPQFDIKGLAIVIKGQHYDEDIAKALEQGRKEGSKKSKLVTPPVGGSGKGAGANKSNVIRFNDSQLERMEAMFGTSSMTATEKKVNYILYYPEQFSEKIVSWAKKKDNGGN